MSVFNFDGLAVHYDVVGEGTPVLFMHGLAANRAQSQSTLAGVAQELNCRFMTLDMPGHGESKLPDGAEQHLPLGFNFYSQIGFALLSHLDIKSAVLGGISMGAGIAQTMALARPKSVLGLFLVRPAWLAEPARPNLNVVDQVGVLLKSETPNDVSEKLSTSVDFQTRFSGIKAAADSALQMAFQSSVIANPWLLRTMIDDRPITKINDLARLSCPTIVVGNNADPLHPPQLARAIANATPGARYEHSPPRYLEPEAHRAAIEQHFKILISQCIKPHGELTNKGVQ